MLGASHLLLTRKGTMTDVRAVPSTLYVTAVFLFLIVLATLIGLLRKMNTNQSVLINMRVAGKTV